MISGIDEEDHGEEEQLVLANKLRHLEHLLGLQVRSRLFHAVVAPHASDGEEELIDAGSESTPQNVFQLVDLEIRDEDGRISVTGSCVEDFLQFVRLKRCKGGAPDLIEDETGDASELSDHLDLRHSSSTPEESEEGRGAHVDGLDAFSLQGEIDRRREMRFAGSGAPTKSDAEARTLLRLRDDAGHKALSEATAEPEDASGFSAGRSVVVEGVFFGAGWNVSLQRVFKSGEGDREEISALLGLFLKRGLTLLRRFRLRILLRDRPNLFGYLDDVGQGSDSAEGCSCHRAGEASFR